MSSGESRWRPPYRAVLVAAHGTSPSCRSTILSASMAICLTLHNEYIFLVPEALSQRRSPSRAISVPRTQGRARHLSVEAYFEDITKLARKITLHTRFVSRVQPKINHNDTQSLAACGMSIRLSECSFENSKNQTPIDSMPDRKRGDRRTSSTTKAYTSTYNALYEFVHALECPLCHELMREPNTFSTCGHTFCKDCVIDTLEGKGIGWPGCPTCKMRGCRKDLERNHLVASAIGQVRRMMEELARANVKASEKRDAGRNAMERDSVKEKRSMKGKEEKAVEDHRDEIENSTEEGPSLELQFDSGTGTEEQRVSAHPTEMPESVLASFRSPGRPFGVCPSPSLVAMPSPYLFQQDGEVTRDALAEDVRVLREVLHVMDEMPVTQGSGGEEESPSTERHLVVREDSRGGSVVPDSQAEEEIGDMAVSSRALQVRETNVERERRKGWEGREESEQSEKKRTQTRAAARGGTPPPSEVQVEPTLQPSKKVRSMWLKAKQAFSSGVPDWAGTSNSMRIVVNSRVIAGDPTVMTLMEKFEAKYGSMVTFEDTISEKTTHFVVGLDARGVTKLTLEYLEACAVGCWVVAPSWIEDSLVQREIVDEKYYAAQGHARDDGTTHMGLPESSRIRAIAGKKIFMGQSFVLPPGAKRSDQLMRLIELAGGAFYDVDETGCAPGGSAPFGTQGFGTASQGTQKKMTCVVESARLSALSAAEKHWLEGLKNTGQVAVVNEGWVHASLEKGQAQLRNDGFYQVF